MDPYTDLLNRQRHLTPPPGAVDRLEQRVMAQVEQVRRARRRRLIIMSGASLCCAAILLVVLIDHARDRKPTPRPEFVESVVILENHTCIWLERVDANPPSGHSHE